MTAYDQITYYSFFLSGAASIVMWSCITLCLTFFDAKYLEDRVIFVFLVVNLFTLLVISIYVVIAGWKLSLNIRMYGLSAGCAIGSRP